MNSRKKMPPSSAADAVELSYTSPRDAARAFARSGRGRWVGSAIFLSILLALTAGWGLAPAIFVGLGYSPGWTPIENLEFQLARALIALFSPVILLCVAWIALFVYERSVVKAG